MADKTTLHLKRHLLMLREIGIFYEYERNSVYVIWVPAVQRTMTSTNSCTTLRLSKKVFYAVQ